MFPGDVDNVSGHDNTVAIDMAQSHVDRTTHRDLLLRSFTTAG